MSLGGKAHAVKRAHFCYMTYLTIYMTRYLTYLTYLTKVNICEYPVLYSKICLLDYQILLNL